MTVLYAANSILIVIDTIAGAMDHNLLPIEFAFIAALTSLASRLHPHTTDP